MARSNDDDPYVPSDKEVAECNEIFAQLAKQNEEIDAKKARRRKNKGLSKANTGIWRDNPRGSAHWKAVIAGLAEAYGDLVGNKGDARDQIAKAAGISNAAFGQNARARHPNAIGAVIKRRPYSPGDAGKSVQDFIKTTKQSNDPSALCTYRDAKNGKVLISAGGRSLKRATPQLLSLAHAINEAKRTKSHADRDRACTMILSVAETYGEGRWLFHGKRKPRSTS
jgi:hypothetical protein